MEDRESYLQCLVDVAREALRPAGLDVTVPRILQYLGETAGVCRVYLFENERGPDERMLATIRYEWCRPGVEPQIENAAHQQGDYDELGFGRWKDVLSRGEFIAGHVSDLPDSEQPPLQAQGVVSILVLPILVHDACHGFIGFDVCAGRREWHVSEISLLRAAADTIAQLLERHEVERQLRLTQFSIEHASAPVFWADCTSRILYGNSAACAMLGYTPAELTTLCVADIDPKMTAERWLAFWQAVRRQGRHNVRPTLRAKNGRIFPAELHGSYIEFEGDEYFMVVIHDITERERAEQECRAAEERLRRVTEQLPVAVWTFDRNLRITYHSQPLNPRLRDRFGPCGLMGRTVQEALDFVYGSEPQGQQVPIIRRALAGETVRYDNCMEGQYFQSIYAPLRDAAGAIVGVVSTGLDVTEHQRLESQAAEAQRMESLGRFAAGIAHDFRNILAGVTGNLSFLEGDMPPHLQSIVTEALQAADRAAGLTRQLLAFARQAPSVMQSLDLNAVVRETVSLARAATNRRVDIVERLQSDLPAIKADDESLHRVIMNLLINADEAIQAAAPTAGAAPRPHAIEVSTRAAQIDAFMTELHHGRRPGDFVVLSVRDDGIGLDQEAVNRLFEPFASARSNAPGRGMGLSIVHGIVAQHNGWIEVESAKGRGSTFNVYLPATQDAAPPAAPAGSSRAASKAPLRGGSETILVVDDAEHIRRLIRRALERVGYRVLLASDGQQALDVYERQSEQIQLIILDASLPARSGGEVLQQILIRNPLARSLIVSGYSGDGVAGELLARGAMAYLPKPFRTNDLVALVRDVLDRPLSI